MGRPAKPSALKLVTGNPGKRAINKQEPEPDLLEDLAAPAWLPARAVVVWDEIAPKLRNAKVLTEIDVEALAQGCVAVANFRYAVAKCGDDLVKPARIEKNDAGKPVQVAGESMNPWLIVNSMSHKQAMAVFQKFGMTPADRSRLTIQPQGDLFGNGNQEKDPYFG
ncbi:MAG: phage terminase small subunit P27 family [Rubrivivax sp.]|nr:MAG: phage terminase small subunit P27 family [Rubrivivax sp.]